MNEEIKNGKKPFRVKKVFDIIISVFIVLVFLLLCAAFVSRLAGKNNGVLGFHVNIIGSDSMEPEIMVGDIILSRSYKGQKLEVGDVVTYVAKSGEKAGELITHKIVEIEGSGEDIIITTKGVNALSADAPMADDEVVSVMFYKTVLLKYVYRVLTTPWGFALLVVIPLVATIAGELFSLTKQLKKKKLEE